MKGTRKGGDSLTFRVATTAKRGEGSLKDVEGTVYRRNRLLGAGKHKRPKFEKR